MSLDYKKNKGLTLIEIMVSVVITCLVMVYGMSFFMAAWRLQSESNDYSRVLTRLGKMLEVERGAVGNTAPIPTTIYSDLTNELLPSGKIAAYRMTKVNHVAGMMNLMEIKVTGEWPVNIDVNSRKRIIIKTNINKPWA